MFSHTPCPPLVLSSHTRSQALYQSADESILKYARITFERYWALFRRCESPHPFQDSGPAFPTFRSTPAHRKDREFFVVRFSSHRRFKLHLAYFTGIRPAKATS